MKSTTAPEKAIYNVYFAGDLFDHKHLTGNQLLAQKIEALSNGLYKCCLPQDWDSALQTSMEIRNKNIKGIITADIVFFNFDGTDLDSGTVVEFVIAKMLDIPAVLLRTDFRAGGFRFGESWNLMALGYPRCVTVKQSAIPLYNAVGIETMHKAIAQAVIDAAEKAKQEPSVLKSYDDVLAGYQHIIKMCGSQLENLVPLKKLHEIIESKIQKGIYTSAPLKKRRSEFVVAAKHSKSI